MRSMSPKYRITPSLLNKWQDLLDADKHWEEWYGNSDEPSISSEDYYAKCEQELLDACNRVPFVSEAASRGTALNELVDCILENRKPKEGMTASRVYAEDGNDGESGRDIMKPTAIRVALDGFEFLFDIGLVRSIAEYFKDATCQYRCEAVMDTIYGPVILYGDADYIMRDIVYDLKSTSKYSAYGKFESGWQKVLYPWALVESGEMESVSGFEYTIVPLSGGTAASPLITGEIKREYYAYNHDVSTALLRSTLENFICWIEAHRELITHPRIFNEI